MTTDLEHQEGADTVEANQLDYWRFVSLAKSRLNQELVEVDTRTSHLALALNRTSEIMKSVAESKVHRPLNLTWSSFQMLFVLWIAGAIDQSKLTTLTSSSKATISNISASLESRGLVERHPSPHDRRTLEIHLTPSGQELVAEAYLKQNKLLFLWSSALTESEQQTLSILLGKLMDRKDIFSR